MRRVAVTLTDWDGVIPSMDTLSGSGGDLDQPLTPYQAAIKAHAWGATLSDSTYQEALRHLKACVEANPDCAITHAILSDLYFSDFLSGIGDIEDGLGLAGSHARRAVALDPASPRAHWALGQVCFARGDLDGFESEFSEALALNPNDITINASYGLYHAGLGETDRAMRSFEAARNLSGHAPTWAFMIPWLRHLGAGDYAAALTESDSIAIPGLLWGALTHAVSLGMTGREAEAQVAVAELLTLHPDFPRIGHDLVGRLVRSSQLAEAIFEGLRLAGLAVVEPEIPEKNHGSLMCASDSPRRWRLR